MRIENKTPSEIEELVKPYFKEKKTREPIITNSALPETAWTRKIVERVRISDLAREHGVNVCPRCNYVLYFDDSRGWFCCGKKRWRNECNFFGNIVDFVEFLGGEL